MGRVAATSVARIYTDVNAKLGPSWHEYGQFRITFSIQSRLRNLSLPDNLQVQWGSQDHYEIVRKVGRGKYSEVCPACTLCHPSSLNRLPGLRGNQHSKRRKMHYQSTETGQEEENQTRDQNSAKSRRRSEYRRFARRCAGSVVKDPQPYYRIRQQRRLQGPLSSFQ